MRQYKVVDEEGVAVFFHSTAFKTALEYAEEFIARNKGKRHLRLYYKDINPGCFKPWVRIKNINNLGV